METHVFRVWHRGVDVENGEVNAQKFCPWGADDGINEEFGRGEISHGCTFVARMADAIATNSESNGMYFVFLRPIIATYAAIGWAFMSWGMRFGDEETCVSARYVSDTLEEVTKFVGKTT
jgi:hypothetical protein